MLCGPASAGPQSFLEHPGPGPTSLSASLPEAVRRRPNIGETTARRSGRAPCRGPVSASTLTRIEIQFSNVSPCAEKADV